MIVSIKEARKILGKAGKEYTDAQIEEIVNLFEAMSDLAIDTYIERKRQGKLVRQRTDKKRD